MQDSEKWRIRLIFKTDTIAAISTGLTGDAGIGIVRISGDDAVCTADKLFVNYCGKKLSEYKTHTIHYGKIVSSGKVLDEVLVSVMRGPHSYTGEDTVEINCHGGMLVLRKVLEAVFEAGARPAQPGEFTKRAFLNGRMDLAQAESVIDVIQSKNDYALSASVFQLTGKFSTIIRAIRAELLDKMAYIEAALDDPEHYVLTDEDGENLLNIVDNSVKKVNYLLKTSDNGHILRDGIQTVILGKTNAGKSTLLNVLSGRECAIVTDIAGTTRDTLEETVNLDGITLNLIDTAGIRDTEDVIEQIGINKALVRANQADFIIYVVDGTVEIDDNDRKIISLIRENEKKAVVILNKSDQEQVIDVRQAEELTACPVIALSAKEETGLDILSHTIQKMFFNGEIALNEEAIIVNARQKSLLKDALKSLELVCNGIHDGMPEDCYMIDLTDAYEILGQVIGEEVEEDLVNQIFAKFCMGK